MENSRKEVKIEHRGRKRDIKQKNGRMTNKKEMTSQLILLSTF